MTSLTINANPMIAGHPVNLNAVRVAEPWASICGNLADVARQSGALSEAATGGVPRLLCYPQPSGELCVFAHFAQDPEKLFGTTVPRGEWSAA